MNEDIVKLGKYLKKELDIFKEEITDRLDAIEEALTTTEEEDDNDEYDSDDEYSEFDDFEDEDLEEEEIKPVKRKKPIPIKQVKEEVEEEEEFDYDDDDLESPTALPDDVENEINKLTPEEKEHIFKRKIQIKKPRIIKNESTETN